jgi:low temperature requirement protein LtrA
VTRGSSPRPLAHAASSGRRAERQRSSTEDERGSFPVELLWDLVFAFALTQVTTIFAHRATWLEFAQAMLLLALIYWAWSAFAWAANAQEAGTRTLRPTLLAAAVLIFVSGLALPQAFGREGLLFAGTYGIVRLLHLGLHADAARKGNASWAPILRFAATVLVGNALLVVGALLPSSPRLWLWAAAVAIDYAGPGWIARSRLRDLQHVVVSHFAERYGAFVIICIGESIATIGVGVGTAERPLSLALVLGATMGMVIATTMWWTYFDRLADAAKERLRQHPEPVVVATDAYAYLHLLLVAGVMIFAGGVKLVVDGQAQAPLSNPGRLATCGGAALYLIGVALFRWRLFGEHTLKRLVAASSLIALFAAGGSLPEWSIATAIAALLVGLCTAERFDRTGEPASPPKPRKLVEAECREGPTPDIGSFDADLRLARQTPGRRTDAGRTHAIARG